MFEKKSAISSTHTRPTLIQLRTPFFWLKTVCEKMYDLRDGGLLAGSIVRYGFRADRVMEQG